MYKEIYADFKYEILDHFPVFIKINPNKSFLATSLWVLFKLQERHLSAIFKDFIDKRQNNNILQQILKDWYYDSKCLLLESF